MVPAPRATRAERGFRTVAVRYVPANSEEEPVDPERTAASGIGRWVGWLVVLALTLRTTGRGVPASAGPAPVQLDAFAEP